LNNKKFNRFNPAFFARLADSDGLSLIRRRPILTLVILFLPGIATWLPGALGR